MTWIRTIPPEQAQPELRDIYERLMPMYPPEYKEPVPALVRPDGTSDRITVAHSLMPEAMWHMMAGFAAMLKPGLPLGRREQEMIAAVVSARNQCVY
jgi:hypothetical protein